MPRNPSVKSTPLPSRVGQKARTRASRFVIQESPGYLVNTAARLFAKALHIRIARHGVPIGQWPFLLFLWEENGLTQKELSRRIQIDDATTVRTIDRMERDGWLHRIRNPHDRREIQIFLTQAGRDLEPQLIPYPVEVNDLATAGLKTTEKAQINALLRHMIAHLQADCPISPGEANHPPPKDTRSLPSTRGRHTR